MQLQITLPTIHCAIALDGYNKAIALNRPDNAPVFIDIREDITATWGKGAMNIDGVEYKYQTWHSVESSASLKKYFKSVIESDYFDRQQHFFGGF